MPLQFGDLGQRCQWINSVIFTANWESAKQRIFHKTTTLETFVDLVENPAVCGNFLDAKNIKPSHPSWIDPILDSTITWNHMMHLKLTTNVKNSS
ncbi:hypothetical protein JVT61DRAFT_15641 [Boletus reticuloceps]|uniref:Uncharacterized protein n=1 Tax=Boletus reticuloceps TaxID=495285 RepID=A0A8I2YCA5_9AGAM|nr:hypothetical protein JVT61DRAFT_15641 [Boletus reticuloceps]